MDPPTSPIFRKRRRKNLDMKAAAVDDSSTLEIIPATPDVQPTRQQRLLLRPKTTNKTTTTTASETTTTTASEAWPESQLLMSNSQLLRHMKEAQKEEAEKEVVVEEDMERKEICRCWTICQCHMSTQELMEAETQDLSGLGYPNQKAANEKADKDKVENKRKSSSLMFMS